MKKMKRLLRLLLDPTGRSELFFHLKRRTWPVLSLLAKLYRVVFLRNVKMVVVIGSLGITTTTYAIRHVLGLPGYKKHQSNVWSALALHLLRTSPFQKFEVIEVGIGNVNQMKKFAWLIRPEIVVVTSIASEHTGLIGTLENIRKEKTFMLKVLKKENLIFYNGDDNQVKIMKNESKARKISFGFQNNNEIICSQLDLIWPKGMKASINYQRNKLELQTRIFTRQQFYSVLAAYGVSQEFKIEAGLVKERLESFTTPSGRMNVIQLQNKAFLIRDDYKATYESIAPALDFLQAASAERRILIMGDSIEMPEPFQENYHKLGEKIGQIVDQVYFIGQMEEFYAKGAIKAGLPEKVVFKAGNNWKNAFNKLPKNLGEGDIIMVKAVAFQRLQRFSLALLGEKIACERNWCEVKSVRCEHCGWKKENNDFYAQKSFAWDIN